MTFKKLLILILIAFSCKSKESNLFQINPMDWEENTFTLTEIADDIIYIA